MRPLGDEHLTDVDFAALVAPGNVEFASLQHGETRDDGFGAEGASAGKRVRRADVSGIDSGEQDVSQVLDVLEDDRGDSIGYVVQIAVARLGMDALADDERLGPVCGKRVLVNAAAGQEELPVSGGATAEQGCLDIPFMSVGVRGGTFIVVIAADTELHG